MKYIFPYANYDIFTNARKKILNVFGNNTLTIRVNISVS